MGNSDKIIRCKKQISALFVKSNGVYSKLGIVDPWPLERDARKYKGPFPVITHPPCKRWGRYWSGGPSVKVRRFKGDDDGCFASALWAVRTFSGVLEHPEASHAWDWFGLQRPPRSGGWTSVDQYGGRSCCVEQGHYGHLARKATWLYIVPKFELLELKWGPSSASAKIDCGFHSKTERQLLRNTVDRSGYNVRFDTPKLFALLLIDLVLGITQSICDINMLDDKKLEFYLLNGFTHE